MRIIGIDPGKSGALWCVDENGKTTNWKDMPIKELFNGVTHPDPIKILSILNEFAEDDDNVSIVIERCYPVHGSSAKSMFSFGINYAFAVAPILISGYRYDFVSPNVWKKALGLSGGKENKGESVVMAERLDPKNASKMVFREETKSKNGRISQVLYHDRAEAFLIAEYYRRVILRGETTLKETKNDK